MEISGIEGESRIAGHSGWLALTSFRWGGRRAVRTHTSGSYRMSSTYSTAQLSDVTVTRQADSASALIWDAMMKGSPVPMKFHWLRAGHGGEPTTYLEGEFENAIIVAIETGSAGGRPVETLVITYEALEFRVVNVGNVLSGPQDVVSYRLGA
ncbi:type VI secretion system tube protein Hcp [Roseomonas eburnea]|uniref:Type VI secretion system tube protein Hcp n=1 Tax=Neoroseomonas eburnea TaxID=1346889 RepID=A0A9X9XK36_9PROT|nr:type VI secretion system tube protein Hcp [Neoroseomonas eburnea]MBR0684072.1 type VI secretion system tube protein Hcp [Neoroseomonas eburnea]